MLQIGSVRTNFSMPDVLSIGLGGGSLVVQSVTKGEAQVIQTYCSVPELVLFVLLMT